MNARQPDRGDRVAGIVLAAGAGRRFGAPKQLASLRGKPLLEHALAAAARAELEPRVVVLGAEAERVIAEVPLHGAEPVVCDRWHEGQASSLRTGIQAVAPVDAVAVMLGDQPLVSAEAIARVLNARDPGAIAVRATYEKEPGHPVVLERRALEQAGRLRGDEGARQLFADAAVREVPCDDVGSAADVDTPEDLATIAGASRHYLT